MLIVTRQVPEISVSCSVVSAHDLYRPGRVSKESYPTIYQYFP